MIGFDPNLQPQYRHDPARAKELLTAAGYPNGLDVELACPVNRFIKDRELCEATAAMLTQVGIRTRIVTPEYSTFFANIRAGKTPFYMFSRGSVIDPSEYLHQYFLPGSTKRLEFEDPKVTDLLVRERGTFDPQERKRVLSELQSAIMEAAPVAFTLQYILNYGVGKRVDWKARSDEYMPASEMRLK
jgi:peptide/nickel transport system substrate-binding protein